MKACRQRLSITVRGRVPRFHWHVLHKGIQDEFYRMLDGVVVDDTKLFNTKRQEWEHFYNFERPHGAPGGQTPTSGYGR